MNTFHVVARPAVLGSDASADQVRDAIDSALTTKYKAVTASIDTVNTLTVREEIAPGSGAIPDESVKTINAAGTRSASDQFLSAALCILSTTISNAAVRGGRGRMFMPPAYASAAAASDGKWLAGNAYWTTTIAFMDELMATHHWGTLGADGDIVPVVYSRTRRARGDASYYFDIKGYRMRTEQHFLRSRTTAP